MESLESLLQAAEGVLLRVGTHLYALADRSRPTALLPFDRRGTWYSQVMVLIGHLRPNHNESGAHFNLYASEIELVLVAIAFVREVKRPIEKVT